MRRYKLNQYGTPETIGDRLIYLRKFSNMTADHVSRRFNINKSTMSRWESTEYWRNIGCTTDKRNQLLKLAEFYHADFYWLLTGKIIETDHNSFILIVDDDATSSAIISMIFKSIFGGMFQEIIFKNGLDALAWAEDNSCMCIMCDYRLPGINGDDLIQKFRQLPHYNSIPIYAITIHDEPAIIEALKNAGADDVLIKPVNDLMIFERFVSTQV